MCRFDVDPRRLLVVFCAIATALIVCVGLPEASVAGQFGNLISPGPLARAHASVKGGMTCQQCHEAGRRVTVQKCLVCHTGIAQRITAKVGVHRAVQDCVSCHAEHAGADADLRHFDSRRFNHTLETRFALDGQHAKVAATCVACHKTRSYLQAQTTCVSCHADPHKGGLGPTCTTCHSTKTPFAAARKTFDHSTARFQLSGLHKTVECAACHKSAVFKPVAFASCASCHQDPHQKRFGPTCTTCHTTAAWSTRSVDHARTDFPLKGAHQKVPCAQCHVSGDMTKALRAETCASCHVDVHKGSFKQDCKSCHSENGFKGAAFDHAQTAFPLDGAHTDMLCARCHTDTQTLSTPRGPARAVGFAGLSRACASCHGGAKDPHQGKFGATCEVCHQTRTFDVRSFRHPRAPAFFVGQHQPLTCDKCHLSGAALPALQPTAAVQALSRIDARTDPRITAVALPSMSCVSCHADVHLGQLSATCETCHDVAAPKFAAVGFSHARTTFPLTGRHGEVACVAGHRTETRAFPSRTGTAMVLHPQSGAACASCHQDPHLGQVSTSCESCHSTTTFQVKTYVHAGMEDFFGGLHGRYECAACHKKENASFPAGRGTAVRFKVGRTCESCHRGF